MATYSDILYEVEEMVATITLNRPETMNALTLKTYVEIEQAIKEADYDNDVRAVIITGAGRGFCSGDDLKEMPGALDPTRIDWSNLSWDLPVVPAKGKPMPLAVALMSCNTPLIAAVNGPAVGWGMEIALMCDVRFASDVAKFGEVFISRGMLCDVAGFLLLPKIVGLSRANELLLTGDVIDGAEAERIGLVSRTVPPEELMPVARATAEKMASVPPVAARMTKEAVRKALDYDLDTLGEYHSYANRELMQTEDFAEGSLSVLEKRKPEFKGR